MTIEIRKVCLAFGDKSVGKKVFQEEESLLKNESFTLHVDLALLANSYS